VLLSEQFGWLQPAHPQAQMQAHLAQMLPRLLPQ
jgi:hypothetical protein